jgi:amidase
VLITPTLAALPLAAERWSGKGWLANVLPAVALTPFLGPWRLAGFPTMSIPVGRHSSGLPIGAQLVAVPGAEQRLLSVAAQLEVRNPWPGTIHDDRWLSDARRRPRVRRPGVRATDV